MAFRSAHKGAATSDDILLVPLDRAGEWAEPEEPPRDWKKIVLVTGLAALSWVATYVGMLELIESNMGSLPLLHKVIIGFSVGMLMTMIVWLLDQIFSPIDLFTKLTYVAGYVFLTLISVGFGFGFYWKVLESRAEAARSATSAVGQVQSSLHGAATRLEQLQATLVQLATISAQKAELERSKGSSCPNSSPGDGPRRKMRDEDAARFSFASDFVKGRVGAINADMAALDADLAKIVADDPSIVDAKSGTRNEFMRSLGRRLDMTVTSFNAFRTDPQLRQVRTDLADRAERTTIADGRGGTIACPDAQLQIALRGVVRAIDQLPNLEKPEIAAVEGSEATIEAFRRLTATFYGLLAFKLPPSADELRTLQQRAVQSIENPAALRALNEATPGLSQRDCIPLGTAVFVDLCLLLVSIGRPMNRFVATRQRMLEAERGPVFPILSRFNEIHNHEEIRRTFDVFREVIFESGGTYYVAVPLNAPRGHPQREALRRDAQTLANLCYALEGQGVLTRPWKLAPVLVARRKLRRQGSKFIECYQEQRVAPVPRLLKAIGSLFVANRDEDEAPAFRIYAFKSGAWPELILGAVMGAASRVEAARRNKPRTAPAAAFAAAGSTTFAGAAAAETKDLSKTLFKETFGKDAFGKDAFGKDGFEEDAFELPGLGPLPEPKSRNPFRARPGRGAGARQSAPANVAAASHSPKPDFRQRFGNYASHAQAELATYRDLDEEEAVAAERESQRAVAEAANNNTGPGAPSQEAEPASADIVVPFPAQRPQPAARATQALAERLAGALAAANEPGEEPSIGVELRRETATFRIPVSEAALPAALAALGDGARAAGSAGTPRLEAAANAPAQEAIEVAAASAAPAADAIADVTVEPFDAAAGAVLAASRADEAGAFEPPLVLRRRAD